MRVQCSLIINDNEVYEAIQDLKEQKELNPLLARLVTRYIQDENFRFALDAESEYTPQGDVNCDDRYAEIRDGLMTMDIMLTDAENVFSSGKSTLEECMEQAENLGAIKRDVDKETGTVKQIPLIEAKKQLIAEEEAGDDDMLDIKLIARQLKQVTSRVDTLMSDISELKSKGILNGGGAAVSNEPTVDTTKDVDVEVEDDFDVEVPDTPVTEPDDFETTVNNITEEAEQTDEDEFTFIPDEPVVENKQPQSGEASSDIGDLLGSLF